MANTLAYYDTESITAVRDFIVHVPRKYTCISTNIRHYLAVTNTLAYSAEVSVMITKSFKPLCFFLFELVSDYKHSTLFSINIIDDDKRFFFAFSRQLF